MATARADLAVPVTVNSNSPVAGYLRSAVIPEAGSGNTVRDAVNGASITIPQALAWNADGSVSATTTGSATYSPSVPSTFSPNTDAYAFIIDYQVGGYTSNSNGTLLVIAKSTLVNRDGISASRGAYSATVSVQMAAGYGGSGNVSDTQPASYYGTQTRSSIVVIWYPSSRILELYDNGSLDATSGPQSGTQNDSHPYDTFSIGAGNITSTDKWWGTQVFIKQGADFTSAEINTLLTDPYGVFETASGGTTTTAGVDSSATTFAQYSAYVTYLASLHEQLQAKSLHSPIAKGLGNIVDNSRPTSSENSKALASADIVGALKAFDGESHGNYTSISFFDNASALSQYLANASALVNLLSSNQAKESSSSKALAKADTNNVLVASDSKTSVASVATGILESIVASDGSTDTSKAVSSLTEQATTNSLQKAVVDALTAFSASAALGDQFVQNLIIEAFLNESASAADKLSAVSAIVDKAFTSESLNTNSAFLVSIKTLADLLENANASEVITALALLITSVSEISSASDSFNASGQYKALFTGNVSAKDSWDQFVSIIAVQISEVVNANDFYQAYALVSESIFENASLLDSYSNIHQHAAGYLVANAITLAAALSKSDINLETILNGIISILPKK